jgi:hypothetical protein
VRLKSITAYRELHRSTGMDLDSTPIEMLALSFEMDDQWNISIGATNLLDDRHVVAGGANLAGGLIHWNLGADGAHTAASYPLRPPTKVWITSG